jgi:hypothetical protein
MLVHHYFYRTLNFFAKFSEVSAILENVLMMYMSLAAAEYYRNG